MNVTRSYRIEVRNTRYHYVLATVCDDGNGGKLDQAEAERIGRILRTMHAKDENVEVTVHADPIPTSEAMRALAALVDEVSDGQNLPQFAFSGSSIAVTLPDNERGQVDQWAKALGIAEPAAATGLGRYYAHYSTRGEAPEIPGWSVDVTCQLHTQQHASVHGEGLVSPDPEAYAAWKAARDAVAAAEEAAQAALAAADTPEHRVARGWGGEAGQCGVECACGETYDGFDTLAEATDLLNRHIDKANAAAAAAAAPVTPATVAKKSAKARVAA